MTDATKYQRALADMGYLDPAEIDGVFGPVSMAAYNRFRNSQGLPPLSLVIIPELERTLFPKPVTLNPLAILWALIPVFTKGTAMNSDQLQGVARTLLAAAIPYAVAKGWIPAGSADLVISAGVAVLVAVWSVWSKRAPKA